jgi:hypothetical protein
VLDLFDRRLKLYNDVNEAVVYYLSHSGNLVLFNAQNRLLAAWAESRFLFGEEVSDYIAAIREDIGIVGDLQRKMDADGIDWKLRNELIETLARVHTRIVYFRQPFTELCIPYIRMDQKRVRGPTEYLRDKNRERLSHADP